MTATIAQWGISEWGFLVTTLTSITGLLKWLQERRERRAEQAKRLAEEQKRASLEAEMREIQRRGRAPFLRAKVLHVEKTEKRGNQICHPNQAIDRENTPRGARIRSSNRK